MAFTRSIHILMAFITIAIPCLVSGQISTVKHTIDTGFQTGFWLHAIDFDEDGDSDLLAGSWLSGLKWYRNEGGGQFTKLTISNDFKNAWSIHAARIDGDNDIDVVAVGANEDTGESGVAWFETKGNGEFNMVELDATPGLLPHSVVAADIDNDGDNDILVAAWGQDQVLWWENASGDSLNRRTFDSDFPSGHRLDAVDMDNDGMLEVIGIGGGKTTIWQNNGGLDFTRQDLAGGSGFGIFAIDLNLDGNLDIVRTERTVGHLEWYKHNGNFSFDDRLQIEKKLGESWSVDGADFDDDGDMDLVVAGYVFDPNRISFFVNDGNENFSEDVIGEFSRPRSVQAADFDLDGDVDIAAIITGENEIIWFEIPGAPVPKTITVTSPNGGETLTDGNTHTIQWHSSGNISDVKIEYSTNAGASWSTIAATTPNDGSFDWTVPATNTSQGLVRISSTVNEAILDLSDSPFSIVVSGFAITAPNGGETFNVNTEQMIQWTTSGSIPQVKLEYSLDGGGNWTTIIASTANTGSFAWLVPDVITSNGLIRISDASDGAPSDVSDATFSIVRNVLTITSPNGGESFAAGSVQLVTWESIGNTNTVKLEYSTDGGGSWQTIVAITANTGSSVWVLPDVTTSQALVRVTNTEFPAITDQSDTVFSIQQYANVTITSPGGGETWLEGSSHEILWTSPAGMPSVNIEYSTDDGGTWSTIMNNASNSGRYTWLIPDVESDQARIRISDTADGAPFGISERFTLSSLPGLTLLKPNGGEKWEIGSSQEIAWTSTGVITSVNLDFSANGGESWMPIADSAPNSGSLQWNAPLTLSIDCLIRVSDVAGVAKPDTSDAPFSIIPKLELQLATPNGGEEWIEGSSRTIRWSSSSGIDSVRLEYSTDLGVSWNIIALSTLNTGLFQWTIPDASTSAALVRVSKWNDAGVFDVSDNPFILVGSSITVLQPNGGEQLNGGQQQSIVWQSTGSVSKVNIAYSHDGGEWQDVVNETENDGQYSWTVPNVNSNSVWLRITDADDGAPADSSDTTFSISATAVSVSESGDALPTDFGLAQNYPNPFNLETRIEFAVPKVSPVRLDIFNMKGELVRALVDAQFAQGVYSARWDGRDSHGAVQASGVYVYRIRIGGWHDARKLLLVK